MHRGAAVGVLGRIPRFVRYNLTFCNLYYFHERNVGSDGSLGLGGDDNAHHVQRTTRAREDNGRF